VDFKLTYRGVSAYAGAAHFQFMVRKQTMQPLFPLEMDRPMGQVRLIDEKLNNAGLLRLATIEPYVRHMGNVPSSSLNPRHRENNPLSKASTSEKGIKTERRLGKRLARVPVIRRSLMWLYDRLFRLIN
jgi:hypothetical protein